MNQQTKTTSLLRDLGELALIACSGLAWFGAAAMAQASLHMSVVAGICGLFIGLALTCRE